MAKNSVIDRLREKNNIINRNTDSLEEDEISDDTPSLEDHIYWRELALKLISEVKMLDPLARQVFVMRRFEEKTITDIAAHMNVSERTVERHLHRAVEQLKSVIDGIRGASL